MRWTASARRGTSRDRRSGLRRSFKRLPCSTNAPAMAAATADLRCFTSSVYWLEVTVVFRRGLCIASLEREERPSPICSDTAIEFASRTGRVAELPQQSSLRRTIGEFEHHLGLPTF